MTCVYPACEHSSRTRGLCHGHYQTMRSRVREGRVSEHDLQNRGLLMPKGSGGSPASDQLRAFEEGSTVLGNAHKRCTECGSADRRHVHLPAATS